MNEYAPFTAMTYNIRSGRTLEGALDLAGTARAIAAHSPDILALNEVMERVPEYENASQAGALGEALGMQALFAPAIEYHGGQYGIALLSRAPIRDAVIDPVPPIPVEGRTRYYEPRVVLSCVTRAGGRDVHVLVTHMGLNEGERVNAVQVALRALERHPGLPVLLMGDLNDTPTAPAFDPLYERLTDALGREDGLLTFPSGTPQARIDYIFHRGLTCLGARSDDTTASDHRPLIATFK